MANFDSRSKADTYAEGMTGFLRLPILPRQKADFSKKLMEASKRPRHKSVPGR